MSQKGRTPMEKPHAPMLMDWTEEKLRLLDQDQLLNLLGNLDHQRAIGRVNETVGVELDRRISALLTGSHGTKRRKALKLAAARAAGVSGATTSAPPSPANRSESLRAPEQQP